MASKAEQIVAHFTQDPEAQSEILKMIEEIKANPGQHNVDTVIAHFTSDPALTAKIKEIISKVKAGHSMHAIAGYHLPDAADAVSAAETMAGHKAVVSHILAS
jgi:hypothetical protein